MSPWQSELPGDVVSGWVKGVVGLIFGAGGVQLLRVWLENRRLGKKEYRDVLLDRIRELEAVVAALQVTVSDLRVQNALLEQRLDKEK